jgi:hypothetical protein
MLLKTTSVVTYAGRAVQMKRMPGLMNTAGAENFTATWWVMISAMLMASDEPADLSSLFTQSVRPAGWRPSRRGRLAVFLC